MRELLNAGMDPHSFTLLGETVLNKCIRGGQTAIALLLVQHGVNINVLDCLEFTPLQASKNTGCHKCVRYLKYAGGVNNDPLIGAPMIASWGCFDGWSEEDDDNGDGSKGVEGTVWKGQESQGDVSDGLRSYWD